MFFPEAATGGVLSGKHLCQSLFFHNFSGLKPATLIKKRLWHTCFPTNFAKIWRTTFYRKPPVAAFIFSQYLDCSDETTPAFLGVSNK